MRRFPKVATGIFLTFMGLMVLVCIMAYSRKAGATRQDMSTAHILRQQGLQQMVADDPLPSQGH